MPSPPYGNNPLEPPTKETQAAFGPAASARIVQSEFPSLVKIAVSVSSPPGCTEDVDLERERLHSLRTGTVTSNACVSLVFPEGSPLTVPVASQQYLSASCSFVMSSEMVTSVLSSESRVTEDSESEGERLPTSEQPEASLSSSKARLTVACC